jgi:hypothetical protein
MASKTRGAVRNCSMALATALCCVSLSDAARAAVIAADAASDPAYAAEGGGAWKGTNPSADENPPGMDDGGFGFQPWNFAGGFHYPVQSPYGNLNHFIDGVDFAHSSFNDLGAPAFALTNANLAFGGSTARATRVLDAPLNVGDAVSLDFDNPELKPFDPFAASGFVVRLNSGGGPKSQPGVTEKFGFFTTFGFNSGNWSLTDAAGLNDTGLSSDETTEGATFRFTLTAPENYSLEILPLASGAPLVTHTGSLASPASGSIDSLEILMFENGSGNGLPGPAAQRTGEREFYFDNLRVESDAGAQNGDYDQDGDADGADFLLWERTLGSTTMLAADGNGNGVVDAGDLDVWEIDFGAAAGAISAIPEPTGAMAWLMSAVPALSSAARARRRVAC